MVNRPNPNLPLLYPTARGVGRDAIGQYFMLYLFLDAEM